MTVLFYLFMASILKYSLAIHQYFVTFDQILAYSIKHDTKTLLLFLHLVFENEEKEQNSSDNESKYMLIYFRFEMRLG